MANSILITGCSSGFGFAASLLFLQRGWQVAATMRDVSEWKGDNSSKDLRIIALDVSDRSSIDEGLKQAVCRVWKTGLCRQQCGTRPFVCFRSHAARCRTVGLRNKRLRLHVGHASLTPLLQRGW